MFTSLSVWCNQWSVGDRQLFTSWVYNSPTSLFQLFSSFQIWHRSTMFCLTALHSFISTAFQFRHIDKLSTAMSLCSCLPLIWWDTIPHGIFWYILDSISALSFRWCVLVFINTSIFHITQHSFLWYIQGCVLFKMLYYRPIWLTL